MPKHWLTALAVALCCGGLSCNGGNGAAQLSSSVGSDSGNHPAVAPAMLPPLPSPDELETVLTEMHSGPRRASYVPGDLLRRGSDFDTNLDSQRVTADGDELVFSPEFSANASGFDAL